MDVDKFEEVLFKLCAVFMLIAAIIIGVSILVGLLRFAIWVLLL